MIEHKFSRENYIKYKMASIEKKRKENLDKKEREREGEDKSVHCAFRVFKKPRSSISWTEPGAVTSSRVNRADYRLSKEIKDCQGPFSSKQFQESVLP